MELRDFIKETLVQIAQGIVDASAALKDSGARVNPGNVMTYVRAQEVMRRHDAGKKHRDFAVHAKEDKTVKGGLGIGVAGIILGTQGQAATADGVESRIKFRIPMLFPTTQVESSHRDT
jgi:hypothetical protein